MTSLSELKVGDIAQVVGLQAGSKSYRQRLLALGLIPGTRITVSRVAPLGCPIELKVRNACLSLRKSEGDVLMVERVGAVCEDKL